MKTVDEEESLALQLCRLHSILEYTLMRSEDIWVRRETV